MPENDSWATNWSLGTHVGCIYSVRHLYSARPLLDPAWRVDALSRGVGIPPFYAAIYRALVVIRRGASGICRKWRGSTCSAICIVFRYALLTPVVTSPDEVTISGRIRTSGHLGFAVNRLALGPPHDPGSLLCSVTVHGSEALVFKGFVSVDERFGAQNGPRLCRNPLISCCSTRERLPLLPVVYSVKSHT
jgi:hypothetical protein